MVAGGGEAASIITKSVEKLLDKEAVTVTERTVVKDVAESTGKDAAETAGKDAAKDAETAAGRDVGTPLEEGEAGAPRESRTTAGDPVDVATGEVLLRQVDVALPGVLELILERTHISTYRQGRYFGTSWASTLDQRIEVAPDGIRYAAPDGQILTYPPMFMTNAAMPPGTGPHWPLTWQADGSYTIEQPSLGHRMHFGRPDGAYGTELPLLAVSDRNGHRMDLVYDENGGVREIRHSAGYRVAVDTDGPSGRQRVVALRLLLPDSAAGSGDGITLVRFGYDGTAGHLSEVTDSSGVPARFSYDGDGRLTGWRDRNEHWYRYEYDAVGRVARTAGSDGFLSTEFAYDPDGRWTSTTDSLGQRTVYTLDEHRRIRAETDPLGHSTEFQRDERGLIVARTDALGRTHRYTRDAAGNVTAVVTPDGGTATADHNALHLPGRLTQPDGSVRLQEWDERGNLVAVTDPVGAVTRYGYDDHGRLTSVTDATGATTTVSTNAAGLPLAVTDALGGTTRFVRDVFGRVVAVTDPLGNTTRFTWTVEGRITSKILSSGAREEWDYDPEGNQTAHVSAAGEVTRTEYGPFNVTTARTAPDGARLRFGYDSELRLRTVTNPAGATWRYDYDAAGNLVREVDFDGRVLGYTHDPAGRLVQRVNAAGEVTRYTRDPLGRVVRQQHGEAVSDFAYDAAGRLVGARNAAAELRFLRDPAGRVIAESCNGATVESRHDVLGRRVFRRMPSGAEAIWTYGPGRRPVEVRTDGHSIAFQHDAAGREVRRTIGSSAILDQQWDADGRLRSQALWTRPAAAGADPELRQHRAYDYRADGYVLSASDRADGRRTFDLDRAGRVTAVRAAAWTERYAYDDTGNLVEDEAPGAGPRRSGRFSREHDRQGRVVRRVRRTLSGQRREWRYAWDAADRLAFVTTPDGQRWQYLYDPLGRRIEKRRLGPDGAVLDRTGFLWDGKVLAEQDQAGEVTTWTYEPGTFRPVSQVRRNALRDAPQGWVDVRFQAIVNDLAGTPAELVDPSGGVVHQRATNVWGEPRTEGDRPECPLGFPGQYLDEETGLHYNRHRYYEPESAAYLSTDPIGLRGGANPYGYVSNTLRWIDPLGLCPDTEKVPIYRGTGHGNEQAIQQETGYVMSDAARTAYRESGGDIGAAADASAAAHERGLAEWGGEDAFAQAHSEFGTEIGQVSGPRSMISFTTDPEVARNFADGGVIYQGLADPGALVWTNHAGGEAEVLVRDMIQVAPWKG